MSAALRAVWQRHAAATARRVTLTTLYFGAFGPLVGGLPYVWMVLTIPFAYLLGGVPALLCGLLYGLWERVEEASSRRQAVCRGALCGALGCVAWAAWLWGGKGGVLSSSGWLSLHGVPAGAVLAWRLASRRLAASRVVVLATTHA